MHPLARRNLPLLGQLGHAGGWLVAARAARNDGSGFQLGVSRAMRIASSGRLARVLHRQHSISSQP
jgi:hypothetical protein